MTASKIKILGMFELVICALKLVLAPCKGVEAPTMRQKCASCFYRVVWNCGSVWTTYSARWLAIAPAVYRAWIGHQAVKNPALKGLQAN